MSLVIKAENNWQDVASNYNVSRLPNFLPFVKVKLFLSNITSVELLIKLFSLLKNN